MTNLLHAANEYKKAGLSVIPTKLDKSPAIGSWKPFQKEIMTTDQLQQYFTVSGVLGVGIITGAVSGNLEVIDVDCKYDESGDLWDRLNEMIASELPELWDNVIITKTVNNGYHIYYRCNTIAGNKVLAENSNGKPLIETRGEGGYAIAPPTQAYSIVIGSFNEISHISEEQRNILFSIANTFDKKEDLSFQKRRNDIGTYDGIDVFAAFNDATDPLLFLERYGWQIVTETNEFYRLRRPGKNTGVSAALFKRRKIFYPFTTSTKFEARRGYNPVGVYSVLECNGDFSEASRKLYEEEFGVKEFGRSTSNVPDKADITPPLPIDGFPQTIKDIIRTCSETYRIPQDYWAGSVLISTALAIGDKLLIEDKYDNVPIIWPVLIGDVSSGKTFPAKFCLSYFEEKDSVAIKKYYQEMEEWESIKSMNKKERMESGLADKKEPRCFQYLLKDFTQEVLAVVHSVNNRGVLIFRDEISGHFADYNRYKNNGSGQESMLENFFQIPMRVNRVGKPVLSIPKPHVLLFGGIQTELLSTLGADKRLENGFLSRMFPIWPDRALKQEYNEKSLPPSVKNEWYRILDILTNLPEQTTLKISDAAKIAHVKWYNKNVKLINGEKSGYLKGVYGKLDIYVLRMAMVVKGMNLACLGDDRNEISISEMNAAISLVEYARKTHQKIYSHLFSKNKISEISKKDAIGWVLKNTKLKNGSKAIGNTVKAIAEMFRTSRNQVNRIRREMGLM